MVGTLAPRRRNGMAIELLPCGLQNPVTGGNTAPPCGAGTKLKQKAALVAAPAPALDVLEDAELAEAPAAHPAPAPAGTLRRRLDGGALQEGLLHDPLRLHKVRPSTSHVCSGTGQSSHLCADPRFAYKIPRHSMASDLHCFPRRSSIVTADGDIAHAKAKPRSVSSCTGSRCACVPTAVCALQASEPPPTSARPAASAAPAVSPKAPVAKRKKEEVYAWDASLLAGAAGEELCFEEVGACT